MRNIVERLFGTNVVFLPFAAWKKYTKENIMDRKNRMISQQKEKAEILESQIFKIAASNSANEAEIRSLRAEVTKYKTEKDNSNKLINELEGRLKEERNRVVGMASVLQPLAEYWRLTDKFITGEITQVRSLILHSGVDMPSYDYSHIFGDDEVERLQSLAAADLSTVENENRRAHLKRIADQSVGAHILLEWVCAQSASAENHVDPSSGDSMGKYLPPFDKPLQLSDLGTGKALCRAVVGIIYDKIKEYESHMLAPMLAHDPGRVVAQVSFAGPPVPLSLLELDTLRAVQDKPFDLITVTLKLASERLQVPVFKVTDVFAGKAETLYAFCAALMVTSVPCMHDEDSQAVDGHVTAFQRVTMLAERAGSESLDDAGNDAFLSQIDAIHQLQLQFEPPQQITATTSTTTTGNSTLYPPLRKVPEPDLARVMLSSLAAISNRTFTELLSDDAEKDGIGSTLLSQHSVHLPNSSTPNNNNSRTTSTHNNNYSNNNNNSNNKTTFSKTNTSNNLNNINNNNNTVAYESLVSAVDAFLASSVQPSVIEMDQSVMLVTVQHKTAIVEELVRLQRDSIRLRGLRDDGMKLTTNLRKFVFSTLINQMLS